MNRKDEEWLRVGIVTLALVLASGSPYFIAWVTTPEDAHFTGLIFNPQDGNSYIAKMRQGLEGSWVFHLPYTPEPHDGARVFLFHLLLGHVARWVGMPLIAVYHAVRMIGGATLLFAVYGLTAHLSDDVGERRASFLLTALGSGLGWLALLFGYRSADLWVPEAFPVYTLLANAHFPLAMALMVSIAGCGLRVIGDEQRRSGWGIGMAVAAAALGVIQPFGLVAAFGGLGMVLAARAVCKRAIPWQAAAWVVVAGAVALPYPLYMLRAIRADPVLAAWNAQNVTDSPPPWDWALSYGLVLALAVPGVVRAARRGSDGDWLLLGWAGVTLVGMYLPLPLQRRLSLGLGVPMGLLAGMGWWRVVRPRIKARRRGLAQGLVVALCALTPIFLALGMLLTGQSWLYLSGGEWAALAWLRDEGRPDGVVLCAPQMGMFVPAWAGQPVVYGHPFETVDAERRAAQAKAYWAGEMELAEQEAFLQANGVRYVLVGPREQALEAEGQGSGRVGEVVFELDDVKVYEVDGR